MEVVGVLNFEAPSDDNFTGELDGEAGNNIYVVTLKATDSSGGESGELTVLVTVTDLNEEPMFTSPSGMAADHSEGGTVIDADPDTADVQAATYTATDPEGGDVTLSLSGDDAGMFELAADTDDTADASRVLSFSGKPDFEMPGDANGDNIYEVTVVASDGVNTATTSP